MSYINPDPAYWSLIAPLGMSKLNMLKTGLFKVLPRIVRCLLPIVRNNKVMVLTLFEVCFCMNLDSPGKVHFTNDVMFLSF